MSPVLSRLRRTVLAAVHDLALARAHFSQGLLLNTRLVASGHIADVLTDERINEAFDLMHAGTSIRSVVVF